jgi:hypothetical protein
MNGIDYQRIVKIEDLGDFKGELDKYLEHTRGFI